MTEPGFDAEVLLALRGAPAARDLGRAGAPDAHGDRLGRGRPGRQGLVRLVARGARALVSRAARERSGVLRVASHRVPCVAELADDPERIEPAASPA